MKFKLRTKIVFERGTKGQKREERPNTEPCLNAGEMAGAQTRLKAGYSVIIRCGPDSKPCLDAGEWAGAPKRIKAGYKATFRCEWMGRSKERKVRPETK